jgi:hypothetical protein
MKKRIFTLLALLVLLPVMAFATDVVITWEWMLDDPQVTGFRYQLDGEDPDNWTVVDGMTSTCVIEHLDGSKEYTLYLQQTYDGINWSPSAMSTAMPLIASDPMMEEEVVSDDMSASEDMAMVEDHKGEVEVVASSDDMIEEEALTAEEDVIVVEEKMKEKSPYYTSISLRGSGVYALASIPGNTTYDNLSASVGLGLGFNNIIGLSKNVGLGLNINTDLILAPIDGNARASLTSFFTDRTITDYSLRVTLAPEIEFNFGKVVIDVAGLVDATLVDYPYIGSLDIDADYFDHILLGYGGQLGLAYEFNDHFQFATDAKFRRYGGLDGVWGVEVTPALVLTF